MIQSMSASGSYVQEFIVYFHRTWSMGFKFEHSRIAPWVCKRRLMGVWKALEEKIRVEVFVLIESDHDHVTSGRIMEATWYRDCSTVVKSLINFRPIFITTNIKHWNIYKSIIIEILFCVNRTAWLYNSVSSFIILIIYVDNKYCVDFDFEILLSQLHINSKLRP